MPDYPDVKIKIRSYEKSRWTWILIVIAIIAIGTMVYTYWFMPKNSVPKSARAPTDDTEYEYKSSTPIIKSTGVSNGVFSDGLPTADSIAKYRLDEFDAGIASREVFNIDINNDKKIDRITRDRYETGNDHFYFEYKIELNNGNGFTNITPEKFRTIEGAECALQKLHFVFGPEFRVIKISRPWSETWVTPTVATRVDYKLSGEQMTITETRTLKKVCDVSDLF